MPPRRILKDRGKAFYVFTGRQFVAKAAPAFAETALIAEYGNF
jgi:hypothetical protein